MSIAEEEAALSKSSAELAESILRENRIPAARTIAQLALDAESESVRLNASKWIMEYFAKKKGGDNEWEELMQGLRQNDPA